MKILSIVWYKVLPPNYGGQKGIAHFNKYLGRKLQLACLCSHNNSCDEKLSYKIIPELPVSKWQFLNPMVWRKILRIAKAEQPTHILLEHPYHALAALRVKRKLNAKLLLHAHNIEYLRFKEQGKWWWPLLKQYEKRALRKSDLIIFKTETDCKQAIEKFGLDTKKCIVLPYGFDPETSKISKEEAKKIIDHRHGLKEDEKMLLFAGTIDYLPNAEAVESVYKEIAPRLMKTGFKGRIIICGRNELSQFQYLKKLTHPLVIQAGEVDDIETYFAAAGVFINPVAKGGGMQTKNIDALFKGCAVVCFSDVAGTDNIKLRQVYSSPFSAGWEIFMTNILDALQKDESGNNLPAEWSWENLTDMLIKRLAS